VTERKKQVLLYLPYVFIVLAAGAVIWWLLYNPVESVTLAVPGMDKIPEKFEKKFLGKEMVNRVPPNNLSGRQQPIILFILSTPVLF